VSRINEPPEAQFRIKEPTSGRYYLFFIESGFSPVQELGESDIRLGGARHRRRHRDRHRRGGWSVMMRDVSPPSRNTCSRSLCSCSRRHSYTVSKSGALSKMRRSSRANNFW